MSLLIFVHQEKSALILTDTLAATPGRRTGWRPKIEMKLR